VRSLSEVSLALFVAIVRAVLRRVSLSAISVAIVGVYVQPGISQEVAVAYTTITAPGAGTKSDQGTFPLSINDPGVITGFYVNSGSYSNQTAVYHGFLRTAEGTYTTFDAPASGTKPNQGTQPAAINGAGTIAGMVTDAMGVEHCFLRHSTGTYAIVNVSGAGTASGQGTGCDAINKQGTVTGIFIDAAGTSHGFIRATSNVFTTFDVAGAGTGAGNGTFPAGINDSGVVAGHFVNDNGDHGFVRDASGNITTFDAPGSGGPTGGTTVAAINDSGTTAGYYNNDGSATHGFVRTSDKTITPFSVGITDIVLSINNAGAIVGFTVTNNGFRGFVRSTTPSVTKFLPPGCASRSGVVADHINTAGDVVGYCLATGGVYNGFLRTP